MAGGGAGSLAGATRAAALPSAGASRNHLPSDKTPGGRMKGHSARALMQVGRRQRREGLLPAGLEGFLEEGAVELSPEGS